MIVVTMNLNENRKMRSLHTNLALYNHMWHYLCEETDIFFIDIHSDGLKRQTTKMKIYSEGKIFSLKIYKNTIVTV